MALSRVARSTIWHVARRGALPSAAPLASQVWPATGPSAAELAPLLLPTPSAYLSGMTQNDSDWLLAEQRRTGRANAPAEGHAPARNREAAGTVP